MSDAAYRTPASERHWSGAPPEPDLDPRVPQLESRIAILEGTLEHRLTRLKHEIWAEIWKERLKVPFSISVASRPSSG